MEIKPEIKKLLYLFRNRRQVKQQGNPVLSTANELDDKRRDTAPWLEAYHKAEELISNTFRAARGG